MADQRETKALSINDLKARNAPPEPAAPAAQNSQDDWQKMYAPTPKSRTSQSHIPAQHFEMRSAEADRPLSDFAGASQSTGTASNFQIPRWVWLVLIPVIAAMFRFGRSGQNDRVRETIQRLEMAAPAILEEYRKTGSVPDIAAMHVKMPPGIPDFRKDAWRRPMRTEGTTVVSAGADGTFGNDDDVTLDVPTATVHYSLWVEK